MCKDTPLRLVHSKTTVSTAPSTCNHPGVCRRCSICIRVLWNALSTPCHGRSFCPAKVRSAKHSILNKTVDKTRQCMCACLNAVVSLSRKTAYPNHLRSLLGRARVRGRAARAARAGSGTRGVFKKRKVPRCAHKCISFRTTASHIARLPSFGRVILSTVWVAVAA